MNKSNSRDYDSTIHYCADCDYHFGGPPNNVTPEEHADREHDSGLFRGIEDGTYFDYIAKHGKDAVNNDG